jgi:hypothetical protein
MAAISALAAALTQHMSSNAENGGDWLHENDEQY